jgi:hypothetical protein
VSVGQYDADEPDLDRVGADGRQVAHAAAGARLVGDGHELLVAGQVEHLVRDRRQQRPGVAHVDAVGRLALGRAAFEGLLAVAGAQVARPSFSHHDPHLGEGLAGDGRDARARGRVADGDEQVGPLVLRAAEDLAQEAHRAGRVGERGEARGVEHSRGMLSGAMREV